PPGWKEQASKLGGICKGKRRICMKVIGPQCVPASSLFICNVKMDYSQRRCPNEQITPPLTNKWYDLLRRISQPYKENKRSWKTSVWPSSSRSKGN
ncbi:hypothetical protein GOODEAATRI_013150, partial [Goodea atripinnis]